MQNVFQAKEQSIADTPLLLFDCVYSDGSVEHWSTHAVTVNSVAYSASVLKQNVFELQLGSDLGVDAIPRITLELANADSHFSEVERNVGVKGAKITASIVFYNFPTAKPSTTVQVLFKGILNAPEWISEETFRVSASNRLSLQRVVLPQTRIQKRCPWEFPATLEQRQEAVSGGDAGKYSRYFRCGYSPDVPGGVGTVGPDGNPFTSCSYTRSDCSARGMFSVDSLTRPTARFGGIEYVPSTIVVRSSGEKGSHISPVEENEGRYNAFVPLVYGTAWHSPSIVFARNDGNLTHFEILLGMGEIQDIQKVLVNQIEIPVGQSGRNMTGTGWYNVVSDGQRNGTFNHDFADGSGAPLGDPYGSMAFLSVVVPNRINDGGSLPSIKVLMDGLRVPRFGLDGASIGSAFSNNPAWVILDVLSRIGWSVSELDLPVFAKTAAYCDEQIQTTDLFGNPVSTARFQCNLVQKGRRSAADVIRGIRNSSRLFLRYGSNGLLQLVAENSIALQQPSPVANSNALYSSNGGWPAYEFGDGTSGTTGIARTSNGASSVVLWSRPAADTPNRFVAEFQDAYNEYQQDSFSVVDVDDVAEAGQEITGSLPVLGLPHYDQAARILRFYLTKSVHGNVILEFQTSIKALGLTPGDIIAVTYLKENFSRQLFRIVKIRPGANYRTATITAQLHNDDWYYDTNGQTSADAGRRQSSFGIGLPRPLAGTVKDADDSLQFGVKESATQRGDGSVDVTASVSFAAPGTAHHSAPAIPLISLVPSVLSGSGTLKGGQDLYYAISSVGLDGSESGLSFIVHAAMSPANLSSAVVLTGLSFPSSALSFQVYRGTNPSALYQIAAAQPISKTFTDSGLTPNPILPPDPNYDHADFFWRLELQPAVNAVSFSNTTIGSNLLQMIPGKYAGMVARIVSGTGANQERTISSNTDTVITLASSWDIVPDASSIFVVAQGTFQFGATTRTSPVEFAIPDQAGNVIQISGRSANCNGVEAPYEISPLTRWSIGGSGIKTVDADVASTPVFGVKIPDNEGGTVIFTALGFPDLANVFTITAGTYKLYYLDELDLSPIGNLATALNDSDKSIQLSVSTLGASPSYLLIGSEVLSVSSTIVPGSKFSVSRGIHTSTASSHPAGSKVYELLQKVYVVPFARNFFGSPASGDWSYPVVLPNVRIVSAELIVTNSQGDSAAGSVSFAALANNGLRTFSGGQFSFQISGFLSVQANAAPDTVVDGPRVVRDVYAVVKQAPVGAPIIVNINLNASPYCTLTIPAGATSVAVPLDGALLAPMAYQDRLSIDILSVGTAQPGSDLSVIIRV